MVIKGATVLTNRGEPLYNTDIAVENGVITYLGSHCPDDGKERYDGRNKLVVPGFYNTHCHVPMTLLRGLGGNLPLSRWLNEKIFPAENKLTAQYVYYGTLLGIGEMIKSGVISFNDMYFLSENICQGVLETGMKANIAMDGFAFDDKLNNKFAPDKNRLIEFFHTYNNSADGRLKIDMCIHAQYTTTREKTEALSQIAKETGANIQLHLSETEKENRECMKLYNKTPAEFFNEYGVFDSPVTAAHCVYLTESDLDILENKKVTVAHCPISNLKLGSGILNLKKIFQRNINITLGTDGAASNDNLDFMSDLKTALLLQKGITKDATFLSPQEMLKIATANGALSQGRKDHGDIQIGYPADLIVFDLNAVNLQPVSDPYDTLFYAALSENIVLTMIDGKIVYKDGEFKTIDMEKVLAEVKKIQKKIFAH